MCRADALLARPRERQGARARGEISRRQGNGRPLAGPAVWHEATGEGGPVQMTGALAFLKPLRGFTAAGLVGAGAGCGADPEMTGATGAWADVALGVAVGTAAGIGDSGFMFV